MVPTVTRLCSLAILGLAPFWGAGCGPPPTGAKFAPATGVLSVYGTADPDLIVVSVGAGGSIVVNGGQMPVSGGVPTIANTVRIELRGRDGSDYLELDEAAGPLPDGVLLGGLGADVLIGGSGDDRADGGDGDDIVILGDGDDTVVWKPGDDVDTIEGEDGFDTLLFNGDDAGEYVDIANNAGRVRFYWEVPFQDLRMTTELGGIEAIEYLARGGADTVYVGDLTGTSMTQIGVELAASLGGGDGQIDTITVNGTQGDDAVAIAGGAGAIQVAGLQASVQIVGHELANDRLTLHAQAGVDVVDATGHEADGIQLTLIGGLGTDTLGGGEGDEHFNGGDGTDVVVMGGGDDTFVWSPGDDNDLVEGQGGMDALIFNGANVAENIDVSAHGGRLWFYRNVANVTLDLAGVEVIDFIARGGADYVVVNNVTATDLLEVNLDLNSSAGGGDAQPDSVIVIGTDGDDGVQVFGDASEVSVVGLPADLNITGAESAYDRLTIQTFAGEDVVQASGLAASGIQLTADGGEHDDVLIGGEGADVLLGGDGDDVLQGGPGLDVLDGGTGSNIVIQ